MRLFYSFLASLVRSGPSYSRQVKGIFSSCFGLPPVLRAKGCEKLYTPQQPENPQSSDGETSFSSSHKGSTKRKPDPKSIKILPMIKNG